MSDYSQPDATGHFGPYGGTFVAETLVHAIAELKDAYAHYRVDPEFQREFRHELAHFVGRPSPVYHAARMSREIGDAIGAKLRILNLGGGYPVDYAHLAPGSNQVANAAVQAFVAESAAATMVGAVAAQAARELGSDAEILFDPGRSLVADAAVLLTRIENTRMRGDMPWLYLDAGYNLLIDAAAVRWYYHMLNASRMNDPAETRYRVVGPLCDSADCFFDVEGEYLWKSLQERIAPLPAEIRETLRTEIVRLPETRALPAATAPGDVIALLDTGAYTLGEMFQYCGRLRAKAVLVDARGDLKVVRNRDEPTDLIGVAERTAAFANGRR